MKSDVIEVSSREDRTGLVLELAERTAVYQKLSHKSALHLRLLTEEMMGMMRSITGETEGQPVREAQGGHREARGGDSQGGRACRHAGHRHGVPGG